MTASQMRKLGHTVSIVTGYPTASQPKPNHVFDEYTYDDIAVNRYRHSSFHHVRHQCIMEAEHNNALVKDWFYQLLEKCKPDLVHVFHLQRLSGSVLEVCNELKIPYLITVTDFWIICPATQLFLPNNELCAGPQKMMENCIKHLSSKSLRPMIGTLINKMPNKLIQGMVHFLNFAPQLRIGPLANVYALTSRSSYILKQVNQAKRIFVTNRFMQNKLQDNGVYSELIKKKPFGIRRLDQIDESSIKIDDPLTIGFIGTLNYHKGAHILLKAIHEITTSKNIILKVYGNREQFPNYVVMLDDIATSDTRIQFEGTFPPDIIGGVLGAMDLLVVPSLWYENTPLIIHQAHAAKVPVIATDLGGMNETIKHGQNGYLFEAGNVNQLSTLIKSLVEDTSQLEELRNKITSPMFIDQYTDELEEQYSEIIGKRHRI